MKGRALVRTLKRWLVPQSRRRKIELALAFFLSPVLFLALAAALTPLPAALGPSDASSRDVSTVFLDRYGKILCETRAADGTRIFAGTIEVDGKAQSVSGRGNGLISSVVATLEDSFGVQMEVCDYSEHALSTGSDARAAAYVQCALPEGRLIWGCGIDEDIATASVRAVVSAANSAVASQALK